MRYRGIIIIIHVHDWPLKIIENHRGGNCPRASPWYWYHVPLLIMRPLLWVYGKSDRVISSVQRAVSINVKPAAWDRGCPAGSRAGIPNHNYGPSSHHAATRYPSETRKKSQKREERSRAFTLVLGTVPAGTCSRNMFSVHTISSSMNDVLKRIVPARTVPAGRSISSEADFETFFFPWHHNNLRARFCIKVWRYNLQLFVDRTLILSDARTMLRALSTTANFVTHAKGCAVPQLSYLIFIYHVR